VATRRKHRCHQQQCCAQASHAYHGQ
jgi:hypothetical protein